MLQILLPNSIFINEFLNNIENITNKENSISYIIYQLIFEIESVKNNIKPIDISHFLYYFGLRQEGFSGYTQNDAEEFMIILLEEINNDINFNK